MGGPQGIDKDALKLIFEFLGLGQSSHTAVSKFAFTEVNQHRQISLKHGFSSS